MTTPTNPAPAAIETLLAALVAEARHLTPAQITQIINTLRRARDPHAPLMGVPGSVIAAVVERLQADPQILDEMEASIQAEFGTLKPRDWQDIEPLEVPDDDTSLSA